MMAKETDPLEKSVKKIEQQGIINRNNKIDMTKMTWTKKLTLATGFATALKRKNKLQSITHKNINQYLKKIKLLQNYQVMNWEPAVNISCQVKLSFYQKIK